MDATAPLHLDGSSLDLRAACVAASAPRCRVTIDADARARVRAARNLVETILAEGRTAYGINTGFGKLATTTIPRESLRELQHNLLVSHAVGVGPESAPAVVRLMLILRLQNVLVGHSGVREETINLLVQMIERDVLPVVPEQGSVGASGDLAPLSHLALVLEGLGEARFDGERMSGGEALARAGLKPIRLEAKEGLALINGTQFSTAVAALTLHRASELAVAADIACALSLEAFAGSVRPFDARIANLRPHPGHAATAENVRRLMEGSEILASHHDCARVQDPYSFRCVPQVHGACRDALTHLRGVLAREINAVTDNPLLFPKEGDVVSGGNFHAEPIALPCDYATLAAAEFASISERRLENLVNPDLSGLPPFLAGGRPGVNSGLMIIQVTAAALVSENKALAHPASVDSIPTSASKEDHVSMAPIAARKFRSVVENTAQVVAAELFAARLALHWRQPLRAGKGVQPVYELLRDRILPPGDDRAFGRDHQVAKVLLDAGDIVAAAESAVGPLARP